MFARVGNRARKLGFRAEHHEAGSDRCVGLSPGPAVHARRSRSRMRRCSNSASPRPLPFDKCRELAALVDQSSSSRKSEPLVETES